MAPPELVLAGLDRYLTFGILNGIAQTIANGLRLKAGDLVEVGGMPIKIGACAGSRVQNGLVAVSAEYHRAIRHETFPDPLQMMWPDSKGRFQGDALFDRRVRHDQPHLPPPSGETLLLVV